MPGATITKIHYGGWENCWRLSNGTVDLVLTGDVGPRIIRFGFCGGRNEFREVPGERGTTGGRAWKSYGGHRFWHAPEDRVLSYVPDNGPVEVKARGKALRAVQTVEKASGLRKELEIEMGPGAQVKITHRLRNLTKRPLLRAPWALTVMAAGGKAIVPLPPYGPHPDFLQATQHLVLWPFTEMADPRWTWGDRYVQLRQDRRRFRSQKVGFAGKGTWAAYLNHGHLFIKRFQPKEGQPYPDRGASTEIFTNHQMLELESLGALLPIAPAQAAVHVEKWQLFKGVPALGSEAAIDAHVLPRLKAFR